MAYQTYITSNKKSDEYTAMQSNGPLTQVGFRLSLIGFRKKKKVSMTKINIGSKDAEYKVDGGFSWVSCDISTYEGGFKAFCDRVS